MACFTVFLDPAVVVMAVVTHTAAVMRVDTTHEATTKEDTAKVTVRVVAMEEHTGSLAHHEGVGGPVVVAGGEVVLFRTS